MNNTIKLFTVKRKGEAKMFQPKTGEKCGCKRGIQRDNCPNCEGTGWVVDFKAIHEFRKITEKPLTNLEKHL